MSFSSSSILPNNKSSGADDGHDKEPSSVKLFGFSVPRNYDHQYNNKINNSRAMMIKNNKKKIMMIIKPSSSSFKCEYCGQGFATSQALGGHQNAHRAERRLLKLSSSSSHQYHNIAKNIITSTTSSGRIIGVRAPPAVAAARQGSSMMTGGTPSEAAAAAIRGTTCGGLHGKNYVINEVIDHEDQASDDLDLELRLGPITPHNYYK